MKYERRTLVVLGIILAVLISALAYPIWSYVRKTSNIDDIRISYKLDRRLNSGVYGGDHWVSQPTFSAEGAVEARATAFDARDNSIDINPKWTASDPDMVTVSPGQGSEVKITVKRAGQSAVQVTTPEISTELAIKAELQNNVIRFEISQLAVKRTSAGAQDNEPFGNQKEKLSYALGMNLGTGIRKQSLEVDTDLVIKGLKDSLSGGEMLLNENEVRGIVGSLANELKYKQITLVSEKNREQGEAFLAENKNKEGVITLNSGLQYKVIKMGDGKKPTLDDTVVCKYRGTFIDGKEFDNSDRRKEPPAFPVTATIKGWSEALQLMPAGSRWQLFIPPDLAYGANGARNGVGPNATLIFDVELISIKDRSQKGTKTAKAAEEEGKETAEQGTDR
jgi:FKBP-type peptidyl-prolyl cis-trans isomerase FklB